MGIRVDDGVFQLDLATVSYWFRVTKEGHLEHLYFGPSLAPASSKAAKSRPVVALADAASLKRTAMLGSSIAYGDDPTYSLDNIPLEWSGIGFGDYRYSPAEIVTADGAYCTDFRYVSHRITDGSTAADQLPTAYNGDQTLDVELEDSASGLRLNLLFTTYDAVDVITRRAVLTNPAPDATRFVGRHRRRDNPAVGTVEVRRLLSALVDLPNRGFDLITFDGGWIKETHRHQRKVEYGIALNTSTTGGSSNRHNPGFLLAEHGATEERGWVYGFNLVYSGNHLGVVERSNHDLVRVGIGINDHCFSWRLAPGESFATPEAVFTMSPCGFNGVSWNFHDFVNEHIVRGHWKNRVRPVLYNNWEATFFKFNERKLLALADEAAGLGAELFVLDDGWFGARDSDTAGLGDWTVNRKKLPSGLDGLAKAIQRRGMRFGLWFEPEMVNEDSDLYRQHPDWAVTTPGRVTTKGRNQLVLDLTNPQVQDYLIAQVGAVLDSAPIDYVKWDMNRHISDAYSPTLAAAAAGPETAASRQGEFFHRYILGLYRVLGEIFGSRPHILLESCSSGGNRFDLGMLCYSPQIWASDDTDPVERLQIQGGLSYLYPQSTIGAHVSSAPHQQTLRETPLSTRFNVSAFGVLGYELDLRYLTRLEKREIADQVKFYKQHRALLQFGRFSRVPQVKDNKVGWQVQQRDAANSHRADPAIAISGFFQTLAQASEGFDALRVLGLDPYRLYRLTTKPQFLYIERFGELVKHILPVELNPNGPVLRTANKVYKLNDCVETYTASGALLDAGVPLNNQFVGSYYNEHTRLLGDFGSNLYVTEIQK